MEELRLLDPLVVIVVALIRVLFYAIAQYLAKILTPRLLNLPQPHLGVVHPIINDILQSRILPD